MGIDVRVTEWSIRRQLTDELTPTLGLWEGAPPRGAARHTAARLHK